MSFYFGELLLKQKMLLLFILFIFSIYILEVFIQRWGGVSALGRRRLRPPKGQEDGGVTRNACLPGIQCALYRSQYHWAIKWRKVTVKVIQG